MNYQIHDGVGLISMHIILKAQTKVGTNNHPCPLKQVVVSIFFLRVADE